MIRSDSAQARARIVQRGDKDNLRAFHDEARAIHGRFTGVPDIASQFFADTICGHNIPEGTMDSSKKPTPEQKKVRNTTEKDAETVELSVEELEERIAPVKYV